MSQGFSVNIDKLKSAYEDIYSLLDDIERFKSISEELLDSFPRDYKYKNKITDLCDDTVQKKLEVEELCNKVDYTVKVVLGMKTISPKAPIYIDTSYETLADYLEPYSVITEHGVTRKKYHHPYYDIDFCISEGPNGKTSYRIYDIADAEDMKAYHIWLREETQKGLNVCGATLLSGVECFIYGFLSGIDDLKDFALYGGYKVVKSANAINIEHIAEQEGISIPEDDDDTFYKLMEFSLADEFRRGVYSSSVGDSIEEYSLIDYDGLIGTGITKLGKSAFDFLLGKYTGEYLPDGTWQALSSGINNVQDYTKAVKESRGEYDSNKMDLAFLSGFEKGYVRSQIGIPGRQGTRKILPSKSEAIEVAKKTLTNDDLYISLVVDLSNDKLMEYIINGDASIKITDGATTFVKGYASVFFKAIKGKQ